MQVITHLEGVFVHLTGVEMTVQSTLAPARLNVMDAKVPLMVIATFVFPMLLVMQMAFVCVM
jgi:hypothetical protein